MSFSLSANIGDGQPGSWGEGRRGGEAGAIRWLKRRGGLSVPWETCTEGAGSLRGLPVARALMELAKHGEGVFRVPRLGSHRWCNTVFHHNDPRPSKNPRR